MRKLISSLFIAAAMFANAQETFHVNGVYNKKHTVFAFTNAVIHIDPTTVIENGTLIIKDGLIVDAGKALVVPKNAVVQDLKGKHIYPSFIDAYSDYGMPEVKGKPKHGPQLESNNQGAYNWNEAIKPEVNAAEYFNADNKSAEEYRKLGFGVVLTQQLDGIMRGSAALVALGNKKENELIISAKAAAGLSFEKGSSTQDYPGSLMGAIALIRQTYLDAQWYKANGKKNEFNISLEALNELNKLPQVFNVNDKWSALRADKVGDEFGIQYILVGNGDEYQRLEELKSTNAKFIIPIDFPAAYDVEDAFDATQVSLSDMKHWEMAPSNLAAMEKKGILFTITAYGLKDKSIFLKNLRKSIQYGLSETQALSALTTVPAGMLGVSDKVGSLRKNMIANFIITSGNIFDDKNVIYQNWVQGEAFEIKNMEVTDVRGKYDLKLSNNKNFTLDISGEAHKPKASVIASGDSVKNDASVELNGKLISLDFKLKDTKFTTRLSGNAEEALLKGKGQIENGEWISWEAVLKQPFKAEDKKDSAKTEKPTIGEVIYPFTAYGYAAANAPKQETYLVKNTTVWTNEQEGVLQNTDVLVVAGKISAIGKNLTAPVGAISIDGTGKYLTPGIIDEHSHIAISDDVNEATQASTAEVRIGDVINPEDINIYRNLAGGVIGCQLLHGSANPIGGQSGIIKLRWGKSAEEMKIKGADGFIKFALGENVKQANWGDDQTIRFPQSRLGVEQFYYDIFTRAKEYDARMKMPGSTQRRDLDLETVAEILNKKRFISCHSYVQSEINMLMHVGDSMGFKVNTFTHILEGYKVADKMKAHGVGGSTFSDWWAYKMEVVDAIPYNAALMTNVGVVSAINSDDAEMSRRLNQESAKAMKYGKLSDVEAFKLCTYNPAKLLHLDKWTGSVKVGKDADLVLWSDNPLSVYAKVEKTMVDGVVYFDREKDKLMQEEIKKERARLIQKMLDEKKGGGETQKSGSKPPKVFHCEGEVVED